MPQVTSVQKIGERLAQALKKKGVKVQVAMDAIGGVTLPTWYRWIHAEQEGGCKDIASLGLFLGLTPDQLLLEDPTPEEKSPFTEADEAGLKKIQALLAEMNTLVRTNEPDERPVAELCRHLNSLLKIMKTPKAKKRK